MKIDDLKINSYVDGELNEQELKEFEAIMNVEPEIRQKVEDLRKINHFMLKSSMMISLLQFKI